MNCSSDAEASLNDRVSACCHFLSSPQNLQGEALLISLGMLEMSKKAPYGIFCQGSNAVVCPFSATCNKFEPQDIIAFNCVERFED